MRTLFLCPSLTFDISSSRRNIMTFFSKKSIIYLHISKIISNFAPEFFCEVKKIHENV